MKIQLPKKFFAFIAIAMFFFSAAKAQIVYTDVNPDQNYTCVGLSICTQTYGLDLNNDGSIDFTLTIPSSLISISCSGACGATIGIDKTLSIQPLVNNEVESNGSNASKLNQNVLLDSNSIYWTDSTQPMAEISWTSECIAFSFCEGVPHLHDAWKSNSLDKYLGLRLHVNSQTYYGWVRLDVALGGESDSVSFTVKDYAYNSFPDSSIHTGDTGGVPLGISTQISENDFSVFPNPASDKITLSFSSSEKKEIQITNTLGQIVFAEEINSTKEEIDVSEFPTGTYVVSAQTATQKIEKKFLKQ